MVSWAGDGMPWALMGETGERLSDILDMLRPSYKKMKWENVNDTREDLSLRIKSLFKRSSSTSGQIWTVWHLHFHVSVQCEHMIKQSRANAKLAAK